MANIEEIKAKVKRYLQEKCNLDISACYAVCKDMTDDYWDEWRNGEAEELENKEDFSDFESSPVQHLTMQPGIATNQSSENPIVPNLKQPELPIQVV